MSLFLCTVSNTHVSGVCALMFVYEGGDAVIFARDHSALSLTGSTVAEILPSVAPNQQRAACTLSGSYTGMTPPPHTHTQITLMLTQSSIA